MVCLTPPLRSKDYLAGRQAKPSAANMTFGAEVLELRPDHSSLSGKVRAAPVDAATMKRRSERGE